MRSSPQVDDGSPEDAEDEQGDEEEAEAEWKLSQNACELEGGCEDLFLMHKKNHTGNT